MVFRKSVYFQHFRTEIFSLSDFIMQFLQTGFFQFGYSDEVSAERLRARHHDVAVCGRGVRGGVGRQLLRRRAVLLNDPVIDKVYEWGMSKIS